MKVENTYIWREYVIIFHFNYLLKRNLPTILFFDFVYVWMWEGTWVQVRWILATLSVLIILCLIHQIQVNWTIFQLQLMLPLSNENLSVLLVGNLFHHQMNLYQILQQRMSVQDLDEKYKDKYGDVIMISIVIQ